MQKDLKPQSARFAGNMWQLSEAIDSSILIAHAGSFEHLPH